MSGSYFVLGMFGLLVVGLVAWVIAGEVGERRKARVIAQTTVRFQRARRDHGGDES